MSYIGNRPADKTLKLEKQQFTTSATTSYTLNHSVSDPQDIALFINNVRQDPNSAYTVSGTALTISEATASTDTMYCVFLGRAIGTVGIGAGEVTKDKVNFISDSSGSGVISKGDGSSIDGSIQLNCHVNSHGIKLKSPPHSAGATYTLTFPNSIVADKFLKTDGSGNLSFASAGITMVDNWRQTVNFYVSSGFNSLTTNWERADTNSSGFIGTGMTESSGVFTFPQTGIYQIFASWYVYEGSGATQYISCAIELSTNGGSSFGNATQSYTHIENVSSQHSTIANNYILDVTDTTTHKIRFGYESQTGNARIVGNTNLDTSYVRFIRLGDT